eukprot:1458206-Alexandrium_andersonii.AAC.1
MLSAPNAYNLHLIENSWNPENPIGAIEPRLHAKLSRRVGMPSDTCFCAIMCMMRARTGAEAT